MYKMFLFSSLYLRVSVRISFCFLFSLFEYIFRTTKCSSVILATSATTSSATDLCSNKSLKDTGAATDASNERRKRKVQKLLNDISQNLHFKRYFTNLHFKRYFTNLHFKRYFTNLHFIRYFTTCILIFKTQVRLSLLF